jgi:hypothetical protein
MTVATGASPPPPQANGKKPATKGLGAAARSSAKNVSNFGQHEKREMRIDFMGEGTPGPGAYLPASTFAKYSKSSSNSAKKPSSAFRSGSPQRPRMHNEHVPGAGAYSPNKTSIEKNKTNCGNSLKSKTKRFQSTAGGGAEEREKAVEPGPGYYDSHKAKTIMTSLAKKRERMSRQNPGFGASTPAHTLPYEVDIANDQKAFRETGAVSGAGENFIGGHSSGVPRRTASPGNDLSA